MSDTLKLEVVTPDRQVLSDRVSEVQFPTANRGYYGVLPGHTPVMTEVGDGVISFVKEGRSHGLTVFGGFADILPSGCTLLAESAVHVDDIDRADIARRIQSAKEDLADAKTEHARTKAEEFLNQLTTLEGAILPA